MSKIRLQVRQSHAISNAAVGSLIQIGGLSLVQCDIRDWGNDGEEVEMPRLSKKLSVSFRKAPVREKRGDVEVGGRIPVVRFPKWMYCPICRKMYYYDSREAGTSEDPLVCPRQDCKKAKSLLAPMPWVVICSNGHLDDVPWQHLVHRDVANPKQKTCKAFDALCFVSAKDKGARLRIECRSCGASMPLTALKAPTLLCKEKCEGKQPWLYKGEPCDKSPQVAALGDHFVHYPSFVSALDIPPDSRLDPRNNVSKKIHAHPNWSSLKELYEIHGKDNHLVKHKVNAIAATIGVEPNGVWNLLLPLTTQIELPSTDKTPIAETNLLREEEYRALLTRIADYREYERFITLSRTDEWQMWLKRKDIPSRVRSLGKFVTELVGVTRLREVRALKGFTRVFSEESGEARLVPADLVGNSSWLPVAEFYGEGVFFTLDRHALSKLNALPAVQARSRTARLGFDSSLWSKKLNIADSSLPGFIALHTLSHLLIREMAFECGYPAASLRERLYYSDGESAMTGVLIYLAAGEPGGSLGGITRLAEPERFAALLARCVETAEWCALDPVCAEHEGRGESRLNRAACHACCLLAETSCECGNLMLDRRLVVSPRGEVATGLFEAD
jgi:hypothetical protein